MNQFSDDGVTKLVRLPPIKMEPVEVNSGAIRAGVNAWGCRAA